MVRTDEDYSIASELYSIADEIVFSNWYDCDVHDDLDTAFYAGFFGEDYNAYEESMGMDEDYLDSAYSMGEDAQNYRFNPEDYRQYLLDENS